MMFEWTDLETDAEAWRRIEPTDNEPGLGAVVVDGDGAYWLHYGRGWINRDRLGMSPEPWSVVQGAHVFLTQILDAA